MRGSRVLIVDASQSLFPDDPKLKDSKFSTPLHESLQTLHSIPDFTALVVETVKEFTAKGVPGKINSVGIGVICDGPSVQVLSKLLYEKVWHKLQHPPPPIPAPS